jgi:hypothetical protein
MKIHSSSPYHVESDLQHKRHTYIRSSGGSRDDNFIFSLPAPNFVLVRALNFGGEQRPAIEALLTSIHRRLRFLALPCEELGGEK